MSAAVLARAARTSRKRVGDRAEEAVADFLVVRGFRILAAGLRLGHGELDLVAKKGGLVVVVEVRTRGAGAWTSGLASITGAKRRHVLVATERLWRERLVHDVEVDRVRIDVAAVCFGPDGTRVDYVPGAMTAGPAR